MSAFDIESLLNEVRPGGPCGDDISGDIAFFELEELVRPKPPGVVKTEEDARVAEPNWADVCKRAFDLLGRSRHLKVAMYFSLGLLTTEGMSGFRDGLHLIHGLLERFWEGLYPRLDPDDDNDPTERMNILMPLSCEPASQWDPVEFRKKLLRMPLCNSRQAGTVCLRDIQAAVPGRTSTVGDHESPETAAIRAAFRATPPEELKDSLVAAQQAVEHLDGIRSVFEEQTQDHSSPDFSGLRGDLVRICRVLEEYVGGSTVPSPAAPDDSVSVPAAQNEPVPVLPGEVRSRADALAAIEQACRYFERHEPSSPVPLLLRRAQKLAPKTFLQIIEDICPNAMAQVVAVGGSDSGGADANKT